MKAFDYIVVGAGSAGCVLAHDLCAGGRNTVLVLENGPGDRHPFVKIPLGYGFLFNDKTRNYRYHTAPNAELGARSLYYPRGKCIGGSGSINALVWCRGMPADYDAWADRGLSGWGWEDVRPVFDSLDGGDDRTPGMHIAVSSDLRHAFTRHFAAAAEELGWPTGVDFNGPAPEGAGYYSLTTKDGSRHSSADAFLRPALKTGTVQVKSRACVTRVVIEQARASGVIYRQGNTELRAIARLAVVMAAGAIGSPQILQLSGVGDGRHLQKLGIETVLHNPNVGQHLQDHLAVGYYYRATEPTLNDDLCSLTSKGLQTLRYLATRRGPLANSVNQFGGFVRTSETLGSPDQQLYLNPATYTIARGRNGLVVAPDAFPAYTLSFQPTRPTSRGAVRLAAPDIETAPVIDLNALSTEKDCMDVVAGGRLTARLVKTSALRSVTEDVMTPCPTQMTDDEILTDFRNRAGSVFHPCGSCAMGTDPQQSVVDPNLAVHGLKGLFVADASVFPSIPSGNINAPTLMVARVGAARILRDTQGETP